MYRMLLLFSLLAASATVSAGASASDLPVSDRGQGPWGVASAPGSCVLHASTDQGSVVSLWSFAGQSRIGFLIQNREWDALREGQRYDLEVNFTGGRAWPVKATGRHNLDTDGPGYFFTVEAGDQSGDGFLDALASARGMAISRDGSTMDKVSLAGSREAVSSLARCMSRLWARPSGSGELKKQDKATPEVPSI